MLRIVFRTGKFSAFVGVFTNKKYVTSLLNYRLIPDRPSILNFWAGPPEILEQVQMNLMVSMLVKTNMGKIVIRKF